MMTFELTGLHHGAASGPLRLLDSGLSFWGGFDLPSGAICDASHPQKGLTLTGCILAMASGRGSSSSSSVLAEAIRLGVGPAGILLLQADPILILGAMAADQLYHKALPIAVADAASWAAISDASRVHLSVEPTLHSVLTLAR